MTGLANAQPILHALPLVQLLQFGVEVPIRFGRPGGAINFPRARVVLDGGENYPLDDLGLPHSFR
ncbi:hypothetical protein AYJ54_01100 [Bradyrhizobium centrolobii]|uniref:Uncharacterized protein n=1 Tax=Bradyrhizobium centrolobii TaxID=1505087 RepID=A0A176YFX0_9BRAD|nr:hypothetical protein AYJ54_01100 [Bradyrhizobium centrolobii]